MREKRSNGRVTTKTSVEDEIVHLRGLAVRARWQSVLQNRRPIICPVICCLHHRYRIRRSLRRPRRDNRLIVPCQGIRAAIGALSASIEADRTPRLKVLVREWDRQSQRVMVMSDGLPEWQTHDSLPVASPSPGTKWNGPRSGRGTRRQANHRGAVMKPVSINPPLRDLHPSVHRTAPRSSPTSPDAQGAASRIYQKSGPCWLALIRSR
jgi:hypothetical protein